MADTQVFRVMLRMQILPGKEQEFERVWYSVADVVGENPANVGQWLSKSAEEEGVYYIMSDWADEAGFRAFERSDAHVEHRKKLHPYRSHGTMTTQHVVFDLGRERLEARR
ncbi:antibiotic biosynthesis monooxygenase family protein [Nonomuraea rubra]|uniref:Heme-degrading monooxygenase HmoA n=1 Tax=Nonomuraea rubra TaxID=46180 RepID=A0A7X0P786_9ACTN|nr:antibiotic biosynthesis monooxygenase family protein [Nonomuraea rubra]MBB6556569.1 heme-degrading monooxygenase HmoA [Nonomuraea rubra]